MSEPKKNPEEGTSSDHMVALVQKACNNLAVLATSVDEISSLKRLTFLMELQKSWESKADLFGHERNEDRHQQQQQQQQQQQTRDIERADNVTDIVLCHDCGRSDLSTVQKSSRPYVCNQCGLGFSKCLALMRHLLTHNVGVSGTDGNRGNGTDAGSSSSAQAKDFYIFMNSSNGKEAGSDMNVKLESNYGNMYDDDDDEEEEEEEEEEEDYNENGDDEEDDDDDEYSRDSGVQKKSASMQGQKIRTSMDSEAANGLKKEDNNSNNGLQSNDDYASNSGGQKGGSSKSRSQMANSRYSFFPKLECPACGRHFRRTNSLKNHMAIHTSRGPFFSHAQRNVSSNHGGRYKRSRSPVDADDRPALCCDCGKQFVNLKRLKIHALSHSAPERYSCSKCPLKFSVAASLKRHLQRHSGIRPHVCSKCGKSFVRSDELTAHERLHSNRNRFPCPVCGKGFTRSIDMVRHQSCHETTKPYQCNQCEKSFVRHDFLKKHESTHLSRACPFCKDVFENRRNITLHIKKEHPDKSVEDLYNISRSKLALNSEAYDGGGSIASILEPGNLFEVPRGSLQIELSPLVDDNVSPSASLANSQQLGGQPAEREEEFG